MLDRNTTTTSAIRSRTTRSAGFAITGLAVAALAFFVASPAQAHPRYADHVACRHSHGQHASAGWHSAFGFGLFLPHLELRLDRPHRAHRFDRDRHHWRDRQHKHRDRDRRDRRDRRR